MGLRVLIDGVTAKGREREKKAEKSGQDLFMVG